MPLLGVLVVTFQHALGSGNTKQTCAMMTYWYHRSFPVKDQFWLYVHVWVGALVWVQSIWFVCIHPHVASISCRGDTDSTTCSAVEPKATTYPVQADSDHNVTDLATVAGVCSCIHGVCADRLVDVGGGRFMYAYGCVCHPGYHGLSCEHNALPGLYCV